MKKTPKNFGLKKACCDTGSNAIMSMAMQISAAKDGSLAFWHRKFSDQIKKLVPGDKWIDQIKMSLDKSQRILPAFPFLLGGQNVKFIPKKTAQNGPQQIVGFTVMKTCRCHQLPGNDIGGNHKNP